MTDISYSCEVFPASALQVVWGMNEGAALGRPDTAIAGDIYALPPDARALPLSLALADSVTLAAPFRDCAAGSSVSVLGQLRLMAPDGDLALLAVLEIGGALLALPLTPLRPSMGYALIANADFDFRLSEMVLGSFATGTRITCADGTLRPIETLQPGDMLLTRDNGAQPLRWRGKVTRRAEGPFAPVTFPAQVLGNAGPLTVSPMQRIFLYQRGDTQLAGRAEVLIQARYLVDDCKVLRRSGGYADYHSLVFDAHQIIYAEGVPVESLLVSEATLARLPQSLAEDLSHRFPSLNQSAHFATELRSGAASAEIRKGLLR